MSSISMLQKAGTSLLPSSSLGTKNLQLPVSTNGEDYCSSGKTKKTSSPDVSNDEIPKGIRRRLSALSLNNLQDYSIPKGSFSSMRSKSSQGLEHAGSSIRKWWDLGWSWILSRKPAFAQDLEMNDQETSFLGSHNKGSWLHLLYKLRSEFDKILSFRSSSNLSTLPQTFKYDHMNNGVKNKKSSSITSISFPSGGGR